MNDLLDLVVRAHGGLERWRQVNTLDVRLSLAGALYRIKGDFQGIVDVNMKIAVERPFLSLTPYRGLTCGAFSLPSGCGSKTWPERWWRSARNLTHRSPGTSFKLHGTTFTGCISRATRCGTISPRLS